MIDVPFSFDKEFSVENKTSSNLVFIIAKCTRTLSSSNIDELINDINYWCIYFKAQFYTDKGTLVKGTQG